MKNGTSSAEAHSAPEQPLDAQHRGAAHAQDGGAVLQPVARSPDAHREIQCTEGPPGEGPQTVAQPPEGPHPSRRPAASPAEGPDLPLPAGGTDAALGQLEPCTPAPEPRASTSAFMRVLDSLQKRRMDTGLCARIRKVYGDLECEYCGKEAQRARPVGQSLPRPVRPRLASGSARVSLRRAASRRAGLHS